MGVRSYVPQLGRFLQPDPNPGGSANAYAYTYGNPLNESDPSGEFPTYDGDGFVGEGEGLHGEGAGAEGSGLAVGATGAIVPPSAQAQEEEANEEFALYEDAGAGSAEYEEYEEEGGYEYASDQQGLENGKQEAHLETGVLYQPLPETTSGSEGGSDKNSVVPLCEPDSRSSDRSCARDAMINRGGVRGSCGCNIWLHNGKLYGRSGHRNKLLGAAEVTAGSAGAALSGFAFAACVAGGGEADIALHCVLGPGAAFVASVSVIGDGIKELF